MIERAAVGIVLGLAAAVALEGGCDRRAEPPPKAAQGAAPTPTDEAEEEAAETLEPPAMIGAVEVLPKDLKAGVPARASVTTAPGFMLRYEWEVNGRGLGPQIEDTFNGPFRAGDSVRVVVTPYKNGRAGIPMASTPVRVRNSPPVYTGSMGQGFSLNGHVFEVRDPDGDPITFSMEGAPPGMSLNSATGELSWSPPSSAGEGEKVYETTVTASDGNGGEVKVTFPVRISGG